MGVWMSVGMGMLLGKDVKYLQTKNFHYNIAKGTPTLSLTLLKVEKVKKENFDFVLSFFIMHNSK